MNVAEIIAEAIIVDFLQPKIDLIRKDFGRNIEVNFKLLLDDNAVLRQINSPRRTAYDAVTAEVRVLGLKYLFLVNINMSLSAFFQKLKA
jgi:hypothetical protein